MTVERTRKRGLTVPEGLAVIALLLLAGVPSVWRDRPSLAWHAAGIGGGTAIGVFMSLRFGSHAPMSRALRWALASGLAAAGVVPCGERWAGICERRPNDR